MTLRDCEVASSFPSHARRPFLAHAQVQPLIARMRDPLVAVCRPRSRERLTDFT